MRIFYLFAMVCLAACSTGGPVEVDGVKVEAGLRAAADGQGEIGRSDARFEGLDRAADGGGPGGPKGEHFHGLGARVPRAHPFGHGIDAPAGGAASAT